MRKEYDFSQIESAEEPLRKKAQGGGHNLSPKSWHYFKATGGRDGTALPEN